MVDRPWKTIGDSYSVVDIDSQMGWLNGKENQGDNTETEIILQNISFLFFKEQKMWYNDLKGKGGDLGDREHIWEAAFKQPARDYDVNESININFMFIYFF